MVNEIQLGIVLPAAGIGSRLPGNIKKQYRKLTGKEIFIHTLSQIINVKFLKEIILVVAKEDISEIKKIINRYYPSQMNIINFAEGGATRQKSVLNGLHALSGYINMVAIHDAVRPFASTELFDKTVAIAKVNGGAIPVLPLKETIKLVDKKTIEKTMDRTKIFTAQTPQVFLKENILRAHEAADLNNIECTDDSQVAELAGFSITTIPGEEYNLKITSPADIQFAEHLISIGAIKTL
jgi:2-C-methyl-D-erythritol 4-phosphate cytidylyltransferase